MGLIQVAVGDDNYKSPYIRTFFNYLGGGNYFLKAFGKNQKKNNSTGDFCIGCSFQAIKTDARDGSKHPITQTQKYSLSFARLQLPFILFGLEKTTNYVENFNIGIAKKNTGGKKGSLRTNYSKSWTPIIPNSQVFTFTDDRTAKYWSIQVKVNATENLRIIIILTVVFVFLLMICVGYLKWQEMKEDERDDMLKVKDIESFM